MRLRCRSAKRERLGRRRRKSGRWRRGWRGSAMSGETRVVEAEEAVGGMNARLEGTREEVAEEDGGTSALLRGEAHLQGEAHHREVVLPQDVEVLLRRDLACSWHRGLLEVQVEVVEVAGGNVRSRRRNLGALEAGTETVPPGVTHLQGEGLLQEEALRQDGVPLQGVAHLQGGGPLQGVEEVLTMEVDLGGLGLAEVMTRALQEGDRLQGEVPLLVGALRHAVGLLRGEVRPPGEVLLLAGDLRLAEMRVAATEVPGGAVEEEVDLHLGEALRPGEDPHQGEVPHHAVMGLLAMMDLQTGGATVQQATTKLLQEPTTAQHLDLMTELLPSPLASLTKAGPRWPSVKPTWSSHLGRFDLKASLALPWPPPLLGVAS